MSLKIGCINYDMVSLSTPQDLQVFTEELRTLLSNGYTLSVEVFATNINNMDPRMNLEYVPTREINRSKSQLKKHIVNMDSTKL